MSNLDVLAVSRIPNIHEYYFNYRKVSSDVFHAKLAVLRDNLITHVEYSLYDYDNKVIQHNIVTKVFRS